MIVESWTGFYVLEICVVWSGGFEALLRFVTLFEVTEINDVAVFKVIEIHNISGS